MKLGTDKIRAGAVRMAASFDPKPDGNHLDIGAGHGELIALLQQRYAMTSYACDYTPDLMKLPNVTVDIADLNTQKLPYIDGTFDVVTCTEVIEHLENFRFVLREVFRVVRPGGVFVVTTPNVLNLSSRIRYLTYGFANLFGPMKFQCKETTDGHISPIGYFYLAYALTAAGFTDMKLTVDKWQQRSLAWLAALWLPVKAGGALADARERTKYRTVDASNASFVRRINSLDMLLGRTIIVGCRKPASG